MKRVKLFALISLLFIGLGHAWGESSTQEVSGVSLAAYQSNGTQISLSSATKGTYFGQKASGAYWLLTIPTTGINTTDSITIHLNGVQVSNNSYAYTYKFQYSFDNSTFTDFGTTYKETTSGVDVERGFHINQTIGSNIYVKVLSTSGGGTAGGNHYILSYTVSYTTSSSSVTYTEVLFQQAGTPAHPDRHCVVIPFVQNCPQARRLRPQYSFQQAGTPEYIGRFPLWCGMETDLLCVPPHDPLPKGRGSLATCPEFFLWYGMETAFSLYPAPLPPPQRAWEFGCVRRTALLHAQRFVLLFIVCQRTHALRAPPNFPLNANSK